MKLIMLCLVLFLSVSLASSGCSKKRSHLRRRLLHLHKRAARCGDTDSKCIKHIFDKIAKIRRRMAKLKKEVCKGGEEEESPKKCVTSFDAFMRARRARINRMARKCSDEDDDCVNTAMQLLIALNHDHKKQRRIWKRSCHKPVELHHLSHEEELSGGAKITHYDMPEDHWVPKSVWTHEFVCSRIKHGFDKWIRSQERRRDAFHKDAGKCSQNDLACLRMNFQSIIHIQRSIHHGRSLYADRMSTCDRCAPIKVKWARWLRRMRARRHRLQLEACRCDENDTGCMQEAVDDIKKIQERIRQRRKRAFALHGECLVKARNEHKQRYPHAHKEHEAADIPDL